MTPLSRRRADWRAARLRLALLRILSPPRPVQRGGRRVAKSAINKSAINKSAIKLVTTPILKKVRPGASGLLARDRDRSRR